MVEWEFGIHNEWTGGGDSAVFGGTVFNPLLSFRFGEKIEMKVCRTVTEECEIVSLAKCQRLFAVSVIVGAFSSYYLCGWNFSLEFCLFVGVIPNLSIIRFL